MDGCAAGPRTVMYQREAWHGCPVEWYLEKQVRPSKDVAHTKVDMPYSNTYFWLQTNTCIIIGLIVSINIMAHWLG